MIDDETFFAWLDGELPADEAAEVERQVESKPQLRRRADDHRALMSSLSGAFATVSDAPVPDRLLTPLARPQSNVVDFSSWRRRMTPPSFGPIGQMAAMAATLILGIAVGTTLGSSDAPVEMRGGQVLAAGTLDKALDRQLASAEAFGDVRIGLTFRDAGGAICRSFESEAAAGLACRDRDDWRLRGLFAAPEGAGGDYRMAAGPDPRLMDMIDSMMADAPFDAAQERAALERGWR